ncbi:LysR substrate-binding domain-containing protein [Pseudomonas sp. CC6-YY-74]|uniref:LysR substrate-binding domain-containing protein n=1 Tax=Pseudomonas sp. CC6-YY-74 TaxID=1930532 RepID=UPI0009A23E87|nr:LysR substrate-binding domain-containing protein [Pseudomonas sp. CC6-YY-74]
MNDWLPSLNTLRAFEAVSRHLSYRLAADELCVTPAAVKQLVVKLEEAVGTPLLKRQGRGLALTLAGIRASADLIDAFRKISRAVEKMRSPDQDTQLIVSVDPSFASAWLIPRLADFKIKHPAIELLIDSTIKVIDLDRSNADIGIRFGVVDHGNMVVHRLFDEKLCVFCSPVLAKGPPEITRLEDLENTTLLCWDLSHLELASNTRKWNQWTHWLSHLGADHIKPGERIRFTDYNLAVQAAIAGQGLILGSQPILQNIVDANLLINPFTASIATDIGYDLVTTEVALSRPSVVRFIEWIQAEAAK